MTKERKIHLKMWKWIRRNYKLYLSMFYHHDKTYDYYFEKINIKNFWIKTDPIAKMIQVYMYEHPEVADTVKKWNKIGEDSYNYWCYYCYDQKQLNAMEKIPPLLDRDYFCKKCPIAKNKECCADPHSSRWRLSYCSEIGVYEAWDKESFQNGCKNIIECFS